MVTTIGIVGSMITFLGFLFVVWPRVSLSPGESLNSRDPFQTPFIIKNDGYLPINNVDYVLNVENMEDVNHNHFTIGSVDQSNRGIIDAIKQNKSSAIFINRTVVAPPDYFRYIEANLIITYKPFLVPFNISERIRFKTERKNNGEYIWLENYAK